MHPLHWKHAGRFLLAAAILTLPLASVNADNVTLYNFNNDNGSNGGWLPSVTGSVSQGWDYNLDGSGLGKGGWQAFLGTNSANSGSYLTSPCLEIQSNKDVQVDISHRFYFPVSGTTTPVALGQVQFRVDPTGSGTAWGGWQGIPTQYFSGTAPPANYPPDYGPPTQSLFNPLIVSATTSAGAENVQAWSGETLGFSSGDHQPSQFKLDFTTFGLANGYELQFRFLMATSVSTSGSAVLNWEVNSVQIKGATECIVPEPGALVLSATGLGTALFWCSRRRRSARRNALMRMFSVFKACETACRIRLP